MVTEVMLQNAAVEAEQVLLSAVVDTDVQSHDFSKSFEKKMEKLIRKAKRPAWNQVLRYAAIIILVIGLLFGTMMAISPEVRAGVVGWFRMTPYGVYNHYSNLDMQNIPDAAAEMEFDYYLPTLPDGYTLLFETDGAAGEGHTYIYASDTGAMLTFSYRYAIGVGEYFLNVEGYQYEQVQVGMLEAELYTTTEEGQNNVIVWNSKHGGVMFDLNGCMEKEEIVALAESIMNREKSAEVTP